jgi:hypothetical protein
MVVTFLAFVEDRGGMVLGRLVRNAQASTRVCCGVQSLMYSKCCSLEGHGLPALDSLNIVSVQEPYLFSTILREHSFAFIIF